MSAHYPIFVKRDLDGFFGLALDNLVQLLLIVGLCGAFCGMSGANQYFITRHIMPGVAVSLLIGNLFYALQAHWVARREGRSDVTALPYGINTPSLIVYMFFVMIPAYNGKLNGALPATPEEAARFAWQMGLIACLGSGIIEFTGAFVAERLRRSTPRAALLSTLAGIAITFISMTFALQIWQRPLVAMVPMAVVLLVYFSRVRFPLGLPGGMVAILTGTLLAWALPCLRIETNVPMSVEAVRQAWAQRELHAPSWAGLEILTILQQDWKQVLPLLSVIIPMGLFNVLGSLQNIESAEAGGDVFATCPSLAVNGLGTIAAALFGSCFPTTIYIGHPGWKAMGARAGYSTLNGIFITIICLTGTVPLISRVIPIEAGIAIVLWIGVIITAQAFQTSPLRHAPAAAIGLFPAIAAWGLTIVGGAFLEANRNPQDGSIRLVASRDYPAPRTAPTQTIFQAAAGTQPTQQAAPPMRLAATTMQDLLSTTNSHLGRDTQISGFSLHGLILLERGYIFTAMIVAAISAFLIDRRFLHAAGWSLAGAVLTFVGLMHAYQVKGNDVDYLPLFISPEAGAFYNRAFAVAIGYLLMAVVFVAMSRLDRNKQDKADNTIDDARMMDPTTSGVESH